MAIKTNMQDLRDRRERFKKEITLLSQGYSNPKAWPGGKLTVYPWDNDIDRWLTGVTARGMGGNSVLFSVVEKVCDLNGGKVEQLVASEVISILLVARSIQTDCVIEYTTQCPNPACRHGETGRIKVPDELGRIAEKTADYLGYDDITLPDCKDVVRVRPLLVKDELTVEQRPDEDRKALPDEAASLLRAVVAIGGGAPETIEEILLWYRALSPKDAKYLAQKQDEISPRLDLRIPHRCDKCGRDYKHLIGLDKEFFR